MKRSIALIFFCTFLFFLLSGQESREVKKTVPLKSDGRVVIDTYKGSISVTTWDRAEVEIYAKVEPDEDMFSASEDDVRDTEIRIEERSGEVRIKSDYDKLKHHRSGFWGMFGDNSLSLPLVHYTIKMPRTANLKVKDYKSRSKISDLKSEVSFYTYKGDVDISRLDGSLDLETYKGEVRVEFSKFTGDSHFETYKGEIELSLPKNTGFSLDSDLGSKSDFDSDFGFAKEVRSKRRRSYDVSGPVNGGGPKLFLKSTKGTYRLRQS